MLPLVLGCPQPNRLVPEDRELNLRNIKYCARYETSIDGIVIDMKAIVGLSKRHEWKTIKPATMVQGS